MERTSEVLNKAADLIEERGWRYGAGWIIEGLPDDDRNSGNSELCLEGGIQAAAGIVIHANRDGCVPEDLFAPLVDCPAYQAVVEHLGDINRRDDGSARRLWMWNDRQSTDEKVIEVLRACAVIEQAREEQDAAWATYAGLVTA